MGLGITCHRQLSIFTEWAYTMGLYYEAWSCPQSIGRLQAQTHMNPRSKKLPSWQTWLVHHAL